MKDETPRGSWKLAKIVELNVSRDGLSKFVNRRGEQQTLPEGRFGSVLTKCKRRYVTLLKDLDNYL